MSCPAHQLATTRRFLDWEDVDLIRELARSLPPDPVVADLGAGSGTTAGAVFAERPDANVVTVDHSAEAVDWAWRFLDGCGVSSDCWRGVVADSVEAAATVAAPLDMLLIDSSHEYDHTVAELAAWLPRVRPGGVVWCHDYRGPYPGVARAVDEAVARGEIQLIAVRGLGWGGRVP